MVIRICSFTNPTKLVSTKWASHVITTWYFLNSHMAHGTFFYCPQELLLFQLISKYLLTCFIRVKYSTTSYTYFSFTLRAYPWFRLWFRTNFYLILAINSWTCSKQRLISHFSSFYISYVFFIRILGYDFK